jgi:hypothetical protein
MINVPAKSSHATATANHSFRGVVEVQVTHPFARYDGHHQGSSNYGDGTKQDRKDWLPEGDSAEQRTNHSQEVQGCYHPERHEPSLLIPADPDTSRRSGRRNVLVLQSRALTRR